MIEVQVNGNHLYNKITIAKTEVLWLMLSY